MSFRLGSPDQAGRKLSALVKTTDEAIAVFDLLRDTYSIDGANRARTEFLRHIDQLEGEMVDHVFRAGSPTVVGELADRVDELDDERKARLLARKHSKVEDAILAKGLIGLAPANVQSRWADGKDGAQRVAVITSEDVDDEIAAKATDGLAAALDRTRHLRLRDNELLDALHTRFGRDRTVQVLAEGGYGAGVQYLLSYGDPAPREMEYIFGELAEKLHREYESWKVHPNREDSSSYKRNEAIRGVSTVLTNMKFFCRAAKALWPETADEILKILEDSRYGRSQATDCAYSILAGNYQEQFSAATASARAGSDPRGSTIEGGDIEDVIAAAAERPLDKEELQKLTVRSEDPTDGFELREFETQLIERYPKTEVLGAYYRNTARQRTGFMMTLQLQQALRVEDLAEFHGFTDLIRFAEAEEISEYMDRYNVDLKTLLDLMVSGESQNHEFTMSEACAVLAR